MRKITKMAVASLLAVLLAAPAFADDNDAVPADNGNAVMHEDKAVADTDANTALPMPQPQQQAGVTYITGGIGDAERDALQAGAHEYNLAVTSSNQGGHFKTGTDFVIAARHGGLTIHVANTGPLFYAKLPAGHYTMTASNGGARQVKRFEISAHHPTSHIHLVWKTK